MCTFELNRSFPPSPFGVAPDLSFSAFAWNRGGAVVSVNEKRRLPAGVSNPPGGILFSLEAYALVLVAAVVTAVVTIAVVLAVLVSVLLLVVVLAAAAAVAATATSHTRAGVDNRSKPRQPRLSWVELMAATERRRKLRGCEPQARVNGNRFDRAVTAMVGARVTVVVGVALVVGVGIGVVVVGRKRTRSNKKKNTRAACPSLRGLELGGGRFGRPPGAWA